MNLNARHDEPDDLLALPADMTLSADELRQQAEIDALLRLQSGELAVPADLARRIRRVNWHRRVRLALELATAAAILITFTVCILTRPPMHKLDGDRPGDLRGAIEQPRNNPATQPASPAPSATPKANPNPYQKPRPGQQVEPRLPSIPPVPVPPGVSGTLVSPPPVGGSPQWQRAEGRSN